MEPERDVAREDRRVGRQVVGRAADHPLARRQRQQRLLELDRAGVEGSRELRLLAVERGDDLVPALDKVRIRLAHRVDHDGRRLGEERLGPAEQPAVAHRAADELAQHVAAPLVRRQDTVRDQERRRPRVIGDHLVAEALGLERFRVVPEQLPHAGMDRREQVGVVVGRHLLEDARQPFEAHAGVDAGRGQRHERAIRLEIELHEHEVPDLEPARARLRVVGHAMRAFGQVGAPVDMDLGARPARPDVGHPPPVLLVAVREVAPADEALGRQADLVAPDLERGVVGRVGRRSEALGRDAEVLREQLPRPVDGLALEVVAEAPVPEHLEEGVVAGRAPDFLEVVVLAGDAQAALVVDGARVRALLGPGQRVLELHHPRVREEQRLVAGRDEGGARHDRVAALGEEVDEPPPDLGGGQRLDPGVGFVGGNRHRP